MAKFKFNSKLSRIFARNLTRIARNSVRAGTRAIGKAIKPAIDKRKPPPGAGDWIQGVAVGVDGARRFWLYRPPDVKRNERLPLMVMLHGCGQTAKSFAMSTRMNRIATRERFFVLYPEQDRLANAQGCWNWFDTRSGRAYGEATLIMKAIDQVSLLYPVDRSRVAVAGLSAGASMAALLVTRHPGRFKAVVMHSGVPPGAAHSTLSALRAMRGRRAAMPLNTATMPMAACGPPLLVIHGEIDPVVAISNSQTAAQGWANALGAKAGKSRSVQRGKRYAMTVTDFKRGSRTVTTLVEVERLGHAWSGGAATQPFGDEQGPDASRMAWTFVAKQFQA